MEIQPDCINIPEELQEFKINKSNIVTLDFSSKVNFGVKVIKNALGEIERTDYYTDYGELIKSIYYKGSSISVIKHYRNSILFSEERYSDGKLVSKGIYNQKGELVNGIAYKYNRHNQITSIEKSLRDNYYLVKYGYDELNRINSRIISVNNKVINEQTYQFDILDRIVEYQDFNQKIRVLKISKKNELIHYTITDKIGNEIEIVNNFCFDNYSSTEVILNGHKTIVTNKSYTDNIMLKKPYTSEDDLDLIIANLFNSQECVTKRVANTDASDVLINYNIKARVLPISIRKRVLYYNAVNL